MVHSSVSLGGLPVMLHPTVDVDQSIPVPLGSGSVSTTPVAVP